MKGNQNKRVKSIAILAAVVLGIIALAFGVAKFVLQKNDKDNILNFYEYRIQTQEISFSPNDEYTGGEVTVTINPSILGIANVGKTGSQLMTIEYKLTELDDNTPLGDTGWTTYTGPFNVDHNMKVNARLVSASDYNFKGPVTDKDITKIAVAKIGDKTYKTLAEAITAWGNLSNAEKENAKIEMVANTNESVTIPSGENVVIDLKGYTITGETKVTDPNTQATESQSATAITVNGTLNLIDSGKQTTQGGNTTTTYGSVTSTANTAVQVSATGTLTLGTNESATSGNDEVVNTNGPVINGGTGSNGVTVADGGSLNFYDGKITAPAPVTDGDHTAIVVGETQVGESDIDKINTPSGYRLDVSVDSQSGREVATLIKTMIVSFDTNGGTPSTIDSIEAAEGKAYGTYATWPSDPTRDGYTFGGWEISNNSVTSSTIVTQTTNHTLTAIWNPITYTINYNNNTGAGTIENTTATYDDTFTLPTSTSGITKTGYTLKGWSTNQNANPDADPNPDTIYTPGQTVSNLTTTNNDTVTLYAIWKDETAPTNTAPTGTSTTSTITVTCNQTDEGSGIDTNTIQYSIFKDGAWTEWQDNATFDNLTANTTYRIKTRAKDTDGNGYTESTEGTVKTQQIQNATTTIHKDTANGDEITSTTVPINNTTIVVKVEESTTGGTTTVTITDQDRNESIYNLNNLTKDADGTYHIEIPNTKTGEYTITTETTDGTNTATNTVTFEVDRTSPTISETITPTTNTITATAGANDVGSGIDTVTYTLLEADGTPAKDANDQDVVANSTGVFNNLKENHDYKVQITVTDKAGNTTEKVVNATTTELVAGTLTFKEASESTNFTPNTTEPQTAEDKVWKNDDIDVTIATQGNGTSTTYTYQKVGGEASAPISSTTSTIPTENGDYVVTVTTTDGVNTKTRTYYFSIDKTLPTVAISPNSADIDIPQASSTGNIASTLTITEAESGIASVRYAITNDNLNAPANNQWTNASATDSVSISSTQNAGTYYIWTEVTDNAGNVSTSVKTSGAFSVKYVIEYDMNIDKTAVEIISEKTLKTTGNSATIASAPTREGYIFKGWALDENATSATHSAGADYTITGSVRFYAVWSEVVATLKIGNGEVVEYDSVQGAITAAGSSEDAVVTLVKNNITESVTIPNGSNITLNTNGKTLTSTGATITNAGTLTITGDGNITTTATNNNTITNSGTLTIAGNGTITTSATNNNSTIENSGALTATNGTISGTNTSIENQSSGTVNVSGNANVTGAKAIVNAANTTASAHVTITAGTINATETALYNEGNGKFTIGTNDGTVSTESPAIVGANYGYYSTNTSEGTLEFFDGVLKGETSAINVGTNSAETVKPEGYKIVDGTEEINETTYKTATLDNHYTVTYNYDNATSGNTETGKTVTYGEAYGTLPSPEKTGYTFGGWKLNTTTITASTTVNTANDHTLVAQWTANTYTLTANANNGTIPATTGWTVASGSATATKTVTYDSTYGTLPTPTRTGYTFNGWKDANENTYTSTDTVNITADTEIIAEWTANDYTITFNYDGATSGNTETERIVTFDSTYGTLPTPEKTGYTFQGWYLEEDEIESTTTVSTASNHTLKAKWQAETYTITYDYNGGSLANGSTETLSYTIEDTITLPEATKTGFIFKGWKEAGADDSTFTQTLGPGAIGNKSLVAVYETDASGITVYHYLENANDNNYSQYGNAESITTYNGNTLKTGDTVTLADFAQSIANTTVAKTATTLNGTNTLTATVAADGSTTVYIYYTRNKFTLTVSAGANTTGAKITSTNETTGSYKWGETVEITGDYENEAGFTYSDFAWTITPVGTEIANTSAKTTTVTMPAEATTVTSTATRTGKTYRIEYNMNSGSGENLPTSGVYGEDVLIPNPTRTGYQFTGWTAKSSETSHSYKLGTAAQTGATTSSYSSWTGTLTTNTYFKNLTANSRVDLTANWQESTYNIKYNLNGGTPATNVPTSATYNEMITISNPTKTGYTFQGWTSSAEDGLDTTTAVYNSTSKYSWDGTSPQKKLGRLTPINNGTVTLNAVWVAKTYTIDYSLYDGTAGEYAPTSATYDEDVYISNPTKTGYIFTGWAADAPSGSATRKLGYNALSGSTTNDYVSWTGNTINNCYFKNLRESGTVKMKARWQENTYNIAYNLDGGTPHSKSPTAANYSANVQIGAPSKTGYRFAGWTSSAEDGLDTTTALAGKYTYSMSSWNGSASVSDSGYFSRLTSVNGGTVTLTAVWQVIATLGIAQNPVTIDLSDTTLTTVNDTQKQKNIAITGNDYGTLSVETSDPSVATVAVDGTNLVITAISNGTANITLTGTGLDSNGNPVSITIPVTVQTTPTSIAVTPKTATLGLLPTNNTTQLQYTIEPATANVQNTVTWSSSDTSIATVDQTGLVTAVAKGTATITATTANGKTDSATITVVREQVAIPTPVQNLVYNGETQTGVVAESALYTLSGNTAINAGTHTATATLTNSTAYEWSDGTTAAKSIEYEIEQATVTPKAVADGTVTEDGLVINLNATNNTGNNTHDSSRTTWKNLAGEGENFIINNATWGDDYLEFDGNNQAYVGLGYRSYTETTFRVKFSTSDYTGCIIANWESGGYGFHVTSEGKLEVGYYVGSSYKYLTSSITLEKGKIYDALVTHSKDTGAKLYINGQLEDESSVTGTIKAPNNTVLMLGADPREGSPAGELWTGKIYEVSVYNKALTEEELKYNTMPEEYTKNYDGTTAVENSKLALKGVIGDDDVTVSGDFAYESASVGNNKTINVTNIQLSGTDSSNYKLSTNTLQVSGNILALDRTCDLPTELTLFETESKEISFTYTGDDVTTTVGVDDTSIATATMADGTQAGTITINGVEAGTAYATVTIPASETHNSLVRTIQINVKERVASTTIGGVTSYYETVQAAIDAVPKDGTEATVTLLYSGSRQEAVKVVEGQNIIFDINGRELYSDTTQTVKTYGTLKIIDSVGNGNITSNKYSAIYVYQGTLTLGESSDAVSETAPQINGTTYGIWQDAGAGFNFYDGVITGLYKQALPKTPNAKPSGYTVIKETIIKNDQKFEKVYLRKTTPDVVINNEKMYVTDGQKLRLDGAHNTVDGMNYESTTWLDLATNTTKAVTSRYSWGDNCLVFTGNSTWINLGVHSYPYETLHLTFSTNITTPKQEIFNNFQSGGGGIIVRDGNIQGGLHIDGGYKYVDSGVTVVPGVVYDVALTYDGSALKIYVNGEYKNKVDVTGTIKTPTGSTVMAIGANPTGSSIESNSPNWFDGKVYSAGIYDRALTDDEIAQNTSAALALVGGPVSASTITYSMIFNDTVTGFDTDDITISVGTKGTLNEETAGKYYSLKTTLSSADLRNAASQTITLRENAAVDTNSVGTPETSKTIVFDPSFANYAEYESSSSTTPISYYITLEEALNEAQSGHIIKPMKNVVDESESTPTVSSGNNLTLDLDGKTITMSQTVTNEGTLTITGSGILTNATNNTITNNGTGTVTISGGTIINSAGGGLAAVKNVAAGTIKISGGTISKTNSNVGQGNAVAVIMNAGNLEMTGGEILSVQRCILLSSSNTETNVEIKDGKLTATGKSGITWSIDAINAGAGQVKISGGTFTATKGDTSIEANAIKAQYSGANVIITGGDFSGETSGIEVGNSSASVTLGTNDETVISENNTTAIEPRITGGTYGVKVSSGTFNFYDGMITGPTGNSISGTVAETPIGYTVRKTTASSVETAVLGNTYNITLNPNSGTYNGSTSNTTVTGTYDQDVNIGYPTRTGYTFTGWQTSDGTIYDRNLLTNAQSMTELVSNTYSTNALGGWRSASAGTGTRTVIDVNDAPIPGITKGFSLTRESGAVDVAQDAIQVTAGNTYTMSVWAKGTGTLKLQLVGQTPWTNKTFTLSNVTEWTKYTWTVVAGSESGQATIKDGIVNAYFGNNGGTNTIQICGMKLEEDTGFSDLLWSKVPSTTTMPVMIAQWTANTNTPYKVNHYVHDLGTNTYTLNSTENKTGTSDASVTLANLKKTIDGFTYENGFADTGDTTRPSSGAVTTTTIAADGSRIINLYYRRNYLYIQYDVNGGTPNTTSYGTSGTLMTTTATSTSTKFLRGIYGGNVNSVDTSTYVENSNGLHNITTFGLTKTGYLAQNDAEWNTKADGTGTSYDHDVGTYAANGFAGADLSTGDKTVTLYVNWVANNYTEYKTNTTTVVKYYATLSDALAGVSSNNKIKATFSATSKSETAATIESGKPGVVLDLNGKTIEMSETLTNNGTLDIYNSSSTEAKINSSATNTIKNSGTLTMNGTAATNKVTITNTTTAPANRVLVNDASKTATLNANVTLTCNTAIVQPATAAERYVIANNGILNVSGSTITNTISGTKYDRGIINSNAAARVVMTAGTVTSAGDAIHNNKGTGTTTPAIEISGTTTGTKITSNVASGIYAHSTGTIKINGGSISGKDRGIYSDVNSAITVTGGTISGTNYDGIKGYTGSVTVSGSSTSITGKPYGISTTSGNVSVTEGTISATGGVGIYSETGEITLGNNSDAVGITSPSVTGTTYGVQITGAGKLNFYDGIITGAANQSISGGTVTNATNCVTVLTNSNKSAVNGPNAPTITAKLKNSSGATYTSGDWTNQDVWVSLTSSKVGSGISEYQWYENGAWTTRTLSTTGNTGEIKYTAGRNLTIRFRAVDTNGVASEEATYTIRRDSAAPTITVSPTSATACTSKSVTITAADTGGSSLSSSNSYQYYLSTSSTALSGGSWTDYTSGTAFTLGNGKNGTFYLFVKQVSDNAGNVSTANGTATTISSTAYQRFGTYVFAQNYTVTADANGGTIPATTGWTVASGSKTATKSVTYNSTYGTLPTLTRTGYTFLGWCGKNFFNKDATPVNTSTYIKGDGTTGTSSEYSVYQVCVKPNTTYTITNSGKSTAPGYAIYNASGERVAGANYANTSVVTFTTPATAVYMKFSVVTQSTSSRYDKETFQLEENSAATAYEAYSVVTSSTKVTKTENHKITAQWSIKDYTLTVNPNGGTYDGNTSNTTVTKHYGTYYGLNTPTNSNFIFTGWTNSGSGTLLRGDASGKAASYSSNYFTETVKTDTDGSQYTNYAYNKENTENKTVYPYLKYSTYSFTPGHTYRISLDLRINSYSGLGYFDLRHACIPNDYSSTGRVAERVTSSAAGQGWINYTMDRTWSDTTIASANGNSNVAINPLFEIYTSIPAGNTGVVDFDIRNIVIEDITDNTTVSNGTYDGYVYRFGDGDGSVTAQWDKAMFDTGPNVNAKMKQLAGNSSATYMSYDNAITGFMHYTGVTPVSTEYNVSVSNIPIYIWFDNGTIYWWSETSNPYLNEDSNCLFYRCSYLGDIDVSEFDTSRVSNMSGMFSETPIFSIDTSGFDTSNVTDMSGMFANCIYLVGIDISGFDTSNVTNMSAMFLMCFRLESIDISGFDTSNVTDMSGMFYQCPLSSIDVSNFDTGNVTNMSGMFALCANLTSLDLSGFDTSSVTTMSNMFDYCSSLTSLDLSGFDTSSVTNMSNMFNKCVSLTSLDLSGFDTSSVTNMSDMFSYCSSLSTIYASNLFNTDNVTSGKYMFTNCTSIVGGCGTTLNSSKTDKTYAHIDGGTSNPGYFTAKFVTDGATTLLNATNNNGGSHSSSATTWKALAGADGTVTSGTWGDNYLQFDGTTWVNLGVMNSGTQTIEATFSVDSIKTSEQQIIGNWEGGGGGIAVTNAGKVYGNLYINSHYRKVTSTQTITPGTVYHVALTYDGSNVRLYLNGTETGTAVSISDTIGTPASSTVMAIGGNPAGANVATPTLAGKVYTAAVYSRALTADEVAQNSKAGLSIAALDSSAVLATNSAAQSLSLNSVNSLKKLSITRNTLTNSISTEDIETSADVENTSENINNTETIDTNGSNDNVLVELPKTVQLNGTNYPSISEAIAVANKGETIKLLEDISLTDEVIIEEGKEVIINLNGKTLTSTSNNTINNAGILTITGAGIVRNEVENGNVIYNTGILNIENGVITTDKNGGKAVYNSSDYSKYDQVKEVTVVNGEEKEELRNAITFNMKGGKIVTEGIGSIGVYNAKNNRGVITGGIVEVRKSASTGIYNDSELEISDAKVVVADYDATGIYNSDSASICELKEAELTIEAEEIENYELIKNTDQFKAELEEMKPSYGVYNDSKSLNVVIETAVIKAERLKSVAIMNASEGEITLGVDELEGLDDSELSEDSEVSEDVSDSSPIIYAIADNTTAIINSGKGKINFYDGKILTTSTIKNVVNNVLKNYEIYEELSSKFISSTLRLIETEVEKQVQVQAQPQQQQQLQLQSEEQSDVQSNVQNEVNNEVQDEVEANESNEVSDSSNVER